MIEFAFATYLKSRPAISAIVGNRVYANRAPQKTGSQEPVEARIVYRLSAGTVRQYHTGGSGGLVESDIALGIVAETYSKARDLYEAVRNEIDGFSGMWDDVVIDRAFLSPPSDGTEDPTQSDDVGFPAVAAVVEVVYEEALPTNV